LNRFSFIHAVRFGLERTSYTVMLLWGEGGVSPKVKEKKEENPKEKGRK
jgi:hypothetical protein